MNEPLARFIGLYQQLDKQQLHRLPEVYAEQVVFTDPAHRIEGLAALGDYFAALYQRLAYCRFVITSQQQQGQQAWLGWTMTFSHPRLRGGEPVTVEGATRLEFDEVGKVCQHSDYFDLGAMLYEQLPLLGPVVRTIKMRLGA
ncbi:nuclear transport factor 2 family protein [Aeromonas veronii]|uniref:Nuclear transport factor 2 family protein n=1 Tax=Aeromonas veronii TaxID=654 RepID=A0A3A9IXJ0_AERVE|nr:nuclear transport factor 2 family protein [Aeromonas veronii]EKP0246005.1 nuclear transport factor 2 family protein [Aeromonas veronii]PSJ91721.1 transcriptional regulator [Aeromonas veronii]RKJ89496.1 nuclear transport factor 2 family protein [Aeromonas veronii]TNI35798.1 transcriptional regulator [Aeromonas veronii]TNJ19866.1 transcriptional regulator [Aeromonas veronii]